MSNRLKALMIISERDCAKKLIEKIKDIGANFIQAIYAHGTAKSDLLEVLGIGESEKVLILCTVMEDSIEGIYGCLRKDFRFDRPGRGIAFTIPVVSVGGPATLQIISGMTERRK